MATSSCGDRVMSHRRHRGVQRSGAEWAQGVGHTGSFDGQGPLGGCSTGSNVGVL